MPRERSPQAGRKRLEDAHRLWHEALKSYPDADAFVTHVNALIAGLRTVTWVFQASFKHAAGFDAWYAGKQEEMRADPVLRWAVEARNDIEKVGDLDLNSTARVSVMASWDLPPAHEFEVPPLEPPHVIAMHIAARSIPAQLRETGVLLVERRWVAAGLPDRELLDACAHVYAALARVVRDGEQRFGSSHRAPPIDPRPGCMAAGPRDRSAILHLASGKFLTLGVRYKEHKESDDEAAEARYGDMVRSIPRTGDTFSGRVKWLHEAGRGMFLRDGGHITVAFLARDGEKIGMVQIEAEDQQEKYVLLDDLGRHAAAKGANEVIITTESWMASMLPATDPDAVLRPGQREDRGEAVVTYGLTRDGQVATLVSRIVRSAGQAQLEDVAEATGGFPLTLLPTWRAWHGPDTPPPRDSSEPSGTA